MQKESEVVEREIDSPLQHTLDWNHLLERVILYKIFLPTVFIEALRKKHIYT